MRQGTGEPVTHPAFLEEKLGWMRLNQIGPKALHVMPPAAMAGRKPTP